MKSTSEKKKLVIKARAVRINSNILLMNLMNLPSILNWFDLISLFNDTSNFSGYLMTKPYLKKKSSGTIQPMAG